MGDESKVPPYISASAMYINCRRFVCRPVTCSGAMVAPSMIFITLFPALLNRSVAHAATQAQTAEERVTTINVSQLAPMIQ